MKKRLLNNIGLKLVSVVMAIILWFLVVMADNPKDSVSFSNIQVTLINTELLENKFYEVLEGSDRIRVTVEAPRNVIQKLSASDIVAEADVSKLTEVNTVAISYRVLNEEVEILDVTGSRDSVRLNVEDKASEWINVRCNTVGEVAEGYIVAGTTIEQTRIEVSGPKSVIESIDHAGLEIDVSGATSKVSGNVDLHFYDGEGNVVDDKNIAKNAENMHVEVQILATKEVPVEISPTGVPAEGYLATGEVQCEPSTVLIAGTSSALAEVSKITIPERELDITDESSDVKKDINIRRYLDNVSLADSSFNGIVTATAFIEPIAERTLVIPQSNIAVVNLPEGFDWGFAEEAETYRLRISGLDDLVSAVDAASIQGTIDISRWMTEKNIRELTTGTHEIAASFVLPEGVNSGREVTVKINIVRLEEE